MPKGKRRDADFVPMRRLTSNDLERIIARERERLRIPMPRATSDAEAIQTLHGSLMKALWWSSYVHKKPAFASMLEAVAEHISLRAAVDLVSHFTNGENLALLERVITRHDETAYRGPSQRPLEGPSETIKALVVAAMIRTMEESKKPVKQVAREVLAMIRARNLPTWMEEWQEVATWGDVREEQLVKRLVYWHKLATQRGAHNLKVDSFNILGENRRKYPKAAAGVKALLDEVERLSRNK